MTSTLTLVSPSYHFAITKYIAAAVRARMPPAITTTWSRPFNTELRDKGFLPIEMMELRTAAYSRTVILTNDTRRMSPAMIMRMGETDFPASVFDRFWSQLGTTYV